MFNRTTGAVDPKVIAYWGEHYDLAHRIETNWTMLEPDLRGKIHLFVGTDDTFYLDGAAHRLQSLLDRLHGQAQFTFIPGGRTSTCIRKVTTSTHYSIGLPLKCMPSPGLIADPDQIRATNYLTHRVGGTAGSAPSCQMQSGGAPRGIQCRDGNNVSISNGTRRSFELKSKRQEIDE